jgi:hypothetical protein
MLDIKNKFLLKILSNFSARDLVKAAIEANQLAPETQNDLNYLQAVDIQLSGRQL